MKQNIISFSRFNIVGLIISLVVTLSLVMITAFVHKGFNLGIDFSSGQNISVQINENTSPNAIEKLLLSSFPQVNVSQLGNIDNKQYNIKIASIKEEQEQQYTELTSILDTNFSDYTVLSTAYIGPAISQNLLSNSLYIVIFALLLMLLYIWVRFKIQFAVSAILALFHDAIFIVALIGALQIEMTVSTAAAILTIIGYSINDTIVIFDRIRENTGIFRNSSFTKITDISITRTLSRTVITSLTTLLAVLSIFLFATGDIKNFALVLILGIFEGTWSSIFLATPLLYVFGFHKTLTVTDSMQQKNKNVSENSYVTSSQNINNGNVNTDTTTATANREYIDKVRMETQQRKRKKYK